MSKTRVTKVDFIEYASYEDAKHYVTNVLGLKSMSEYNKWVAEQPLVEAATYRQKSIG